MNYDKIYPTLDLHGEYLDNAIILVREFISDNIVLNLPNKGFQNLIIKQLDDSQKKIVTIKFFFAKKRRKILKIIMLKNLVKEYQIFRLNKMMGL